MDGIGNHNIGNHNIGNHNIGNQNLGSASPVAAHRSRWGRPGHSFGGDDEIGRLVLAARVHARPEQPRDLPNTPTRNVSVVGVTSRRPL